MSLLNELYEQSDLYKIRHTAAHVLAQAVLEKYPDAKLGIGPPIDNGFYYDFDLGVDEEGKPISFKPDDLSDLEKRMRQIIGGQFPLEYREISVEDAQKLFANQPYKLELIAELAQANAVISTYRQDSFEDLCRGPHVLDTNKIPLDGFKLMSVAGAYWRGDEKRPMLQRIYGTAWHNKKELKEHLELLEEAKKRDHRKIGRELEIFILDDEVGPGLPLWLPNGNILREELDKLAKEMEDKAGYQRVSTPHIAKEALYLRSRHLPYYVEDMYPPMDRAGQQVLPEADELPVPHPDPRLGSEVLPRPPAAAVRVRHGVPLREVGRGPGAHPGTWLRPGRRPHLLHRGPDRVRVRPLHRPPLRHLPRRRLRPLRHQVLDEARGPRRRPRGLGQG